MSAPYQGGSPWGSELQLHQTQQRGQRSVPHQTASLPGSEQHHHQIRREGHDPAPRLDRRDHCPARSRHVVLVVVAVVIVVLEIRLSTALLGWICVAWLLS